MNLIESAKTYKGNELESIFFNQILRGETAEQLGVRVLYNMPVPTTVQMWEPDINLLQNGAISGWNGGPSSAKTLKTISMSQVKAELGYSARDYFSLIYEKMTMHNSSGMEELSGTELERAETDMFKQAIAEGIRITMWLGDTLRPTGYYEAFDGFLKRLFAMSAQGDVVSREYTKSGVEAPGGIISLFDMLWKDSDPKLKDIKSEGNLTYFVTGDLYDLYEKHLDTISADGAYVDYINGRKTLAYHGIPVVNMHIDRDIYNTPYPKSLCILADRRNMVLAVNTADFPGTEVRMWYNPDQMENRQRAVFMAGCDILNEYLIAYAQIAKA